MSLAFRYDLSGYSFGRHDTIRYRNIYSPSVNGDWAIKDAEIMLGIEFRVRVHQVCAWAFEDGSLIELEPCSTHYEMYDK